MTTFSMLKANIGSLLAAREEGQGMVEYTMIIGAISIVLVAAFITLGLTGAVDAQVTRLIAEITP